jgi:hypothetical protein
MWALIAPLLDKGVGLINGVKFPALPGGRRAAQPVQPGESNNALDHFGEVSKELKLTALPGKSILSNSSTPAPRLSWQTGVASCCSHISSSWDNFRKSICTNKLTLIAHTPKRSLGLSILSEALSNLSVREWHHQLSTIPAYQP